MLIAKFLLQRGLALVYCIGFLAALNQFKPLLGERGLLPVPLFIKQVPFAESPSLFYFFPKDWAFTAFSIVGLIISLLALTGVTERFGWGVSVAAWVLMWALYLSFVNVGQTFYSFGWESMLLEAGFLAIFLGPAGVKPPPIVIWLFRWMIFRVMLGAGLIKLRGDSCWRDFTCLFYHYETQPIPNPLSWYFHWLPRPMLKAGVAVNHFVELIVPFAFFVPILTTAAAVITLVFQGMLLISGNFAFLTLLTMVLATSGIDDGAVAKFLPMLKMTAAMPPDGAVFASWALFLLVAVLSVKPALNLVSPNQAMNADYEPLHLVGTYGAFGTITRPRYEVIVQGTDDASATDESAWKEYEFKGKPGDVNRMPPQIAPYHLRLDWLMWFAGFSSWQEEPWFAHLVAKLLDGDAATLALMRGNPFPDRPPRVIRAMLYEYHFTTPDERKKTGAWWTRTLVGPYFPPVTKDDPGFLQLQASMGWIAAPAGQAPR